MTYDELAKENERLRGDIHYVRMLLRPPDNKPSFKTLKEFANHVTLLLEEGYTILTGTEEYGQPTKETGNEESIAEAEARKVEASQVGEGVTQQGV